MESSKVKILVIFLFLGGSCHSSENFTENSLRTTSTTEEEEYRPSLMFVEPMKNYSKVAGESLKIRCVVRGDPPVQKFKWFKNEAPLTEERGRIRIRSRTGAGSEKQWSTVRFQNLETMDMGFYKCEASNGVETLKGETVIKVHPGNKRKGTSYWSDDDYDPDQDYDSKNQDHGLIPESFPLDLDASLGGDGAISGLPSHIEFQVINSSSTTFFNFFAIRAAFPYLN